MKFRQLLAAISLSLGVSLFSSASALAAHYWQVDISTPGPVINSRTFNVQFTTLSVEADDQIKVEAFQGEDLIGTTTTFKPYGDSGAFTVTVPTDGVYNYHLRATLNDGEGSEVKLTETKSVTVDATAPGAPQYQNKSRQGNTYTVTFKAPSDSDVQLVRIFSSTKTSFTADSSTQVGVVSVSPGQNVSFTYTASDSNERFHAVQAFDAAGNGSALTGDPHVVVRSAANGAATLASVLGGGVVAGANTENDGHVEGGAAHTTKSNKKAAVLGTHKTKTSNSHTWQWILLGLVVVALIYYLAFYRQGRRNPFGSSQAK